MRWLVYLVVWSEVVVEVFFVVFLPVFFQVLFALFRCYGFLLINQK